MTPRQTPTPGRGSSSSSGCRSAAHLRPRRCSTRSSSPSGWHILPFAATLLVARLVGIGGGLASALVAIALVSVDPSTFADAGPTWVSLWPPLPSRPIALEMLTVVAGVGLGAVDRPGPRPVATAARRAGPGPGTPTTAERETHELAALAATLAIPASPGRSPT